MRPAANWLVRVCTLADCVCISWSANIYVPQRGVLEHIGRGELGLLQLFYFRTRGEKGGNDEARVTDPQETKSH